MKQKDIDRFWKKVDRSGGEQACWKWTAAKDSHGYGNFRIGYKNIGAHRFSYEMIHGKILDDLELDHLCRNRACVNPAHLEAVTHKENGLRGISLMAQQARRTHCPQGHLYDIENTYISSTNHRQCKACNRDHVRRFRAEHPDYYRQYYIKRKNQLALIVPR